MGTPTPEEICLLAYMMGWKRGAAGAAYKPEEWNVDAFQVGYNEGRYAANQAYGVAQRVYGCTLNVFRGDDACSQS